MKRTLKIACLALAIAMTAPPSTARAQDATAAPKGNADNGRKMFEVTGCYQCHGYVGQGGGPAGPRLARSKLPFDAFLRQLRKPSSQMPPYTAAVLSEQTAADVYAYIHTLPGPVDMSTVKLPH